jgi:hypothetical protein
MENRGPRRYDWQNFQWENDLFNEIRVLQNDCRAAGNHLSEQIEQVQSAKEAQTEIQWAFIMIDRETRLENETKNKGINRKH